MKKIFFNFLVVCGMGVVLFLIKPSGVNAAVSIISGGAMNGAVNNGGNVTLTFPVGVQQGDVVIFYGGHPHRAGANLGPQTSGYTPIAVHNAVAPNFGAWYKIMGATPDSSVVGYGTSNTADATAYAAYILRGVDTANVFDQIRATVGPITSTNPNAASITTQTANALVIALAGSQVNDTSRGTVTSYSNFNGNSGNDSNDISIDGATREIASPGLENPPAWSTWASGAWYSITIALKPEPPPAVNQITVGTALTQPSYVVEGNTAVVMGAFTFISSQSSATISSIKISEKGTVNANTNLSNVKLYAQQESTCTFAGSTQIGTTQSFSVADEATFGSLGLTVGTAVQQCVFVVLDVGTSAGTGNTIEVEVTASGDVTATGGTIAGTFPVQISGSTVIRADSGTVMSTEIDFDWVPGQTSWGEALWSTTETEGDVKLRLYYTATTPCDTIIPDSALPGNSIGFDGTASPLNISSINTATYNRLCLQATLIAGAAAAPTLNDWAITWGAPAGGYAPLGTYISSPFDTGTPSAFTAIEWNWSKTDPACASCAIRFQIQTAPDAGGTPGAWTPTWAGPEGNDGDETDYFTLSTGEIIHKSHNGNQWVRYRATLDGDGVDTPVLEEVRIFYQLQI